ncbi:leucine-rich repeat protein [Treponema sp.]|uniref:leucine-rich repeat protein n=1 Tax=Treponema sp. TaxID=166 RepID=UPI0025D76A9F|nr:leucine-rich repeat protein [Treponema sp.]MBR4322533.1 leucine-rich repeat protein [Treponema sp.]
MRKIIAFLLSALLTVSLFAQTTVAEKKLGKTLEKNKEASAVFVSEIDLSGLSVSENGIITLPLFAKNKISVVSGMDMTNIKERIDYTKKLKLATTFETKDLDSKTYAITKIDGIESVAQYKERFIEEQKAEARKNLTKMPVQVVNQEAINLSASESAWLPGQIQDKLKSNLQEFLGMKTVVDSKSENALKKLQAESESAARDESTAIEFGKITTAKFALFTKIRKTAKGYTISADFTDLTTGEQMASVISKEYSSSEYLYGSTGAVDEITLSLGNKLGLKISDLNKNLLSSGSASFSVDEQLALARQNEEQFKKLMAQYDSDLAKLSMSNDLSAIENKRKIEAEKALLVEKQNSEKKRQAELQAQKSRAEADAKLEAERSIALKTQRDQMAKDAAAKAAEVRKLKMEKQGVLGQINVIESKKKALVEIRQGVEARQNELYASIKKDCEDEEQKIRNKAFTTVELENGKPTQAANRRRENLVWTNYEKHVQKFFTDAETVKKAASEQDTALLSEVRVDQKALEKTRTVSSMGDELKVSYGTYSGENNGWNAYLSLYSDGVLLYQDTFIVKYEAVTGKKSVNLETETNETLVEEYMANVDMYNSLLTRGDPIIYFEIDYTVKAESDDKPSEYEFNFDKIRVINTVSGKTMQTSSLSKKLSRTMKPEYDLREIHGVVAKSKESYDKKLFVRNRLKEFQTLGLSDAKISEVYRNLTAEWINSMSDDVFKDLIETARADNDISKVFRVYNGSRIGDNHNVKFIIIPNSVTTIGEKAFYECKSLTSVTIQNSVTTQLQVFLQGALRSVTIGKEAFFGCESLKSVTIPNSVTTIGNDAFYGCRSLKSVYYNGTVTEWLSISFSYNSNPCQCGGADLYINGTKLTNLIIPNSVTTIGYGAFNGCKSLTSVTIPNSVTEIGWKVFIGCKSLISVEIPNSVTEIGRSAFHGCESLTSVTIPMSVTSIKGEAFFDCKSLKIVNYTGSKGDWEKIKIEYGNDKLKNAKINYNYKGK